MNKISTFQLNVLKNLKFDDTSENFYPNEDVAVLAIKTNPLLVENLEENIKRNKKAIIKLLTKDCDIYSFLSDELKKDMDIVQQSLENNPLNYKFLPVSLKENESLLKNCIEKYGETFALALSQFKNNKEIALFSIGYCRDIFIHIDKEDLLSDNDLINKQLELGLSLKNICPSKLNDKELMLRAINKNKLEYNSIVNLDLRGDWDIVKAAIINRHPMLFHYLPQKLIDDTVLLTKVIELMYSYNLIEEDLSIEYKNQMTRIFLNKEYRFKFNNLSNIKLEDYIKFNPNALELVYPFFLKKIMASEIEVNKHKKSIKKF